MIITIGTQSIEVTKIMYISPNGNDTNDGFSSNTPIKSLTRMRKLAQDNIAVFFMAGVHEFVDEFDTTMGANMYFLYDADKKMVLYSNPLETKIILKVTKGTSSYNRQQFIAMKKSTMYNLNIECVATGSNDGYNALFIQNICPIYNCFIKITSTWSVFKFTHGIPNVIFHIYNSIICFNQTGTGTTQDILSPTFHNCILTNKANDCKLDTYSKLSSNIYNMTIENILNTNWGEGDPTILPVGLGLKYGPYSMWNNIRYCFHDKDNGEDFYFEGNLKVLTDMHSILFDSDKLYSSLSKLILDVPKLTKKYYNIKMIKEKKEV